jgi:predicted RNase H-like nuclease (RuvC/YqgF family)
VTNQTPELDYKFPSATEVAEAIEKSESEEEIIRVFGEKLRESNDFSVQCLTKMTEKIEDKALKDMVEEVTKKNRELNAELEKVENDLDEKTELCEDFRHRCEFLTKRNSRLIGRYSFIQTKYS